jgi:hypothetical protein
MAISERCAITIIDERAMQSSKTRRGTTHVLFEAHGTPYLAAYCHRAGFQKTFRLHPIRGIGGTRCGMPGLGAYAMTPVVVDRSTALTLHCDLNGVLPSI